MVSVAPWFCHCAEIAVECLERGIHVYSEKPLATEMQMLDKLQQAWEKSSCALDGMFGLRYTPWFRAVRQAIEDGEIGIVRQIHAQKSYKLGRRGELYKKQALYGGILPWVGIHAMDWAMQLGGNCRAVHALHSRQYNRDHGELEVSSAALMELENGVIATVTADFLRPVGAARHDDDRLRVTGTGGMIEVIDGSVFLENGQSRRALVLPEDAAPMNEFIDSIGTEKSKQLTMQALAVTRAALMARENADKNCTDI
jgi:predicted dehydrogenase